MEDKKRIIQEYVPGKQITLSHIIANPTSDLCKKLGLNLEYKSAIGVLTITPSEGAIIAADIACKKSNVEIGFVDRFSGTLIITGELDAVEVSMYEIADVLNTMLGFSLSKVTRT